MGTHDLWCLDDAGTDSDVKDKCTIRSVVMGKPMKLGDQGLELEFVRTATPRWPDMMAIYVPQHRILFSSKLFSAHVASQLAEVKVGSVPVAWSGLHDWGIAWTGDSF